MITLCHYLIAQANELKPHTEELCKTFDILRDREHLAFRQIRRIFVDNTYKTEFPKADS